MRQTIKRAGMALLLASALAPAANAGPILFDPDGASATNPAYNITGLGFGAGNALAINAIPGGGPVVVGSTFQLTFQTHLTSLVGPNAPAAVPGLNSTFQITEVATFTEVVTSFNSATGTATFAIVPSANNRANIYFNNAVVFNDAAGTGFTAGTVIMSLNPNSANGANFTTTGTTRDFNTTGAGKTTTTGLAANGSGSNSINSNVLLPYNTTFFQPPSGTPILTSSIVSSNLTSFFDSVSPSLVFQNLITNATISGNIGAINGVSGPDIQFQVSGFTQSFDTAVPEPASVAMTLIGLGGAGIGSFAARRRRVVAA